MPGGKAHGPNWQYQLECRDVLIYRKPELKLTPWAGDGIDVPLELPDTLWTFDVALRDLEGSLVVAECKRWTGPVKQGTIAEFAYKVEGLRKVCSFPVAGVFVAKTDHQIGAVKVGQFNGIEVVILDEGSTPPGFIVTFLRFDEDLEVALRDIVMHVAPLSFTLTGHDAEFTLRNAAGEVIPLDQPPPAE